MKLARLAGYDPASLVGMTGFEPATSLVETKALCQLELHPVAILRCVAKVGTSTRYIGNGDIHPYRGSPPYPHKLAQIGWDASRSQTTRQLG